MTTKEQNAKYNPLRKLSPKWKEHQAKKHQKEMKNKTKHSARRWAYKLRGEECNKCQSAEKLEFHHTNYELQKGITLCMPCHRKIHINNCNEVKV